MERLWKGFLSGPSVGGHSSVQTDHVMYLPLSVSTVPAEVGEKTGTFVAPACFMMHLAKYIPRLVHLWELTGASIE